MTPGRVARAVTTARVVAAAHGIRSEHPRVLHDGVNVVVHLTPAPVVARVATLTTLLRPDVALHLGREVTVAGGLAAAGAPVLPPSDLVPPGPHRHDGTVLSFWTHVRVLPEAPTPREVASALTGLHGHLAGLPPTGRSLDTPLDDLAVFLERGSAWGVPPAQLARLAARLDGLRPRLDGEGGQLHGDAHPGNLLATPAGWVWTDLEDTCPGPRGWDLACLRTTSRLDGRAALDALPDAPGDTDLAPWLELRRLHAAAWSVVVAVGHPGRWTAARERLATALDGPLDQASGSEDSR
ncbi:phosphotransferase family protein [Geodermatophilus sp. SYSU D00742]